MTHVRHVVLDRDGTLNREAATGWVTATHDWQWEPGVLESLSRLARARCVLSVVTNQSCIGRGVATRSDVDRVHEHMRASARAHSVEFHGVYVCPHAPADACDCRKPRPKLVALAVAEGGHAPGDTLLVGDSLSDLHAGIAAGTRVALVRTGKGRHVPTSELPEGVFGVFDTLAQLASELLEVADD